MSDCFEVSVLLVRCCTAVIRIGGLVVLTDPWFSRRMRFLPAVRPGIPLDAVDEPDVILVSHLHADHFEPRAVARIAGPSTVIVGPPGIARRLPRALLGQVREVCPGASLGLGNLHIEVFPMEHTFPPPRENGYLVSGGGSTIFFAGDASYGPVFARVGAQREVDLALLPVGGSLIWGRRTVMDPGQAVQAALDLKARVMVPTHPGGEWYSVPPLSLHPGRKEDARRIAAERNLSLHVEVLPNGTTWRMSP